jgi:hypothetical protein
LIVALILGYPLSLGPVAKFYSGFRQPPGAVIAFYRPLKVLTTKVPAAEKPILWYLHLWGVK